MAWFIIATVTGKDNITIYGDGKQVRDLLYIEDLLDLYDICVEKIDVAKGKAYNTGGGPLNTISIWLEFSPVLEKLAGKKIDVSWSDTRPGDQPVYISDISKVSRELGWKPKRGVEEGIELLYKWVSENKKLFLES